MPTEPTEIPSEYRRRLGAALANIDRQERFHRSLADARLIAFLIAVVLTILAYFRWISPWWIALPTAAFLVFVVRQGAAEARGRRARRLAVYYERGLARIEGRWAGGGESGRRFLDESHPYAADLDLFGTGSLFDLLCAARTEGGQATLANWLLAPAGVEEIRDRQAAVAELANRLDLREDLALLGGDARANIEAPALAEWGDEPSPPPSRALVIAANVLALLAVVAIVAWAAFDTGPGPFVIVVVVEGIFAAIVRKRVRRTLQELDRRVADLLILGELLARIERETFTSERLNLIRSGLNAGTNSPSAQVRGLAHLAGRIDMQHNAILTVLLASVLWGTRTAFRVEAWRATSGRRVRSWIEAVGEVEALASLATYAAENPGDPFPEIVAGPAVYEAEGLGHPLIPRSSCVSNDVRLGEAPRVLVVSGSNMSGKSTLLRTVGINAVLALAGAPTRAKSLRLSILAIGATLRIQDSLQAGKSRFYAEILRVRQVVDLASRGEPPLLFLLDEIFHGTNSRDRAQGAEGVVRGLIDRGAIGLVSTHDLALAEVADRLAPRAENVHFEDQMVDGNLTFDYRMKPGVVRSSNALALMRAVGLDV